MKRTLMLATLTFATTFGSIAAAQAPGGKANYFPSQKVEITNDVRERRDDRADLRKLEALQDRFIATQKRRWVNRHELGNIDAELKQYLAAELREARYELNDANAEIKDQRRGKDYRGAVVAAKVDQKVERKSLQQVRAIDHKLSKLYGRYDVRSLNAKGKLINELVVLAKAELRDGRLAHR